MKHSIAVNCIPFLPSCLVHSRKTQVTSQIPVRTFRSISLSFQQICLHHLKYLSTGSSKTLFVPGASAQSINDPKPVPKASFGDLAPWSRQDGERWNAGELGSRRGIMLRVLKSGLRRWGSSPSPVGKLGLTRLRPCWPASQGSLPLLLGLGPQALPPLAQQSSFSIFRGKTAMKCTFQF